MKKILYTLISLLVMVSCNHDEIDIPATLQQESGEKVKITFDVNIPEAQKVESRGFDEKATLSSLWLVLFDEYGYYVGKAQAYKDANKKSNEISGVNMNSVIPFYVELNVTENPRIIHFVGNCDLSNAILAGHENNIISRLNVSGGQDAYWQRINIAEIKKKDGATADPNGLFEGVLPGEMNPVHLLRNFAKITVDVSKAQVSNGTFVYGGFDIITTESHGSVAPYLGSSETTSFPTFVKSENDCVSYDNLLGIGYTGFTPGSSQEENTFDKNTKNFSVPPSFSINAQYLYERNNEDGRTYVIVKGTWNGKDTYYKIDLIREVEGSAVTYFHILRNFHYSISILSVEGKGSDTAKEAAAGAASNNIFASVELQHLTNIGKDKARLFVNYTSKTLISNAPVTLEYYFLNENGVAENDRIRIQVEDGKVFDSVSDPVHGSNNVENDGYSYITLTPNTPETLSMEQRITLYDTKTGLQRTVIYTLKQHYEFEKVEIRYATAPSAVGGEFEYIFTLPKDMPKSFFPMTFLVEAVPQTIYPNVDTNNGTLKYQPMPATTLDQSFGYERTVTWEEYSASRDIVCGFKVNTASYNGTVISVSHDLFKTGLAILGGTATSGTFSDLTINGVSSAATVPYGIDEDVTVTFNMDVVDATTLVKIEAAGMASASSSTGFIEKNADRTFTYTPTRKAGKQIVTFKTGNEKDSGSVKISSGETSTNKKYTNTLIGSYTRVFPEWSGLAINGKSDGSAAIEYNPKGTDVTITFNMPVIYDEDGNLITITVMASQLVNGDDKDGSYTYTPTTAGKQTVKLKTDGKVHGAGTVKLTASSGYTTSLEVGFKNVLTLTSSNLRADENINASVIGNNTRDVSVYPSDSYSGALASGLNFSTSGSYALSSGNVSITLAENMSTLYFRYTAGFGNNHNASTTIAAIVSADGATLSFD